MLKTRRNGCVSLSMILSDDRMISISPKVCFLDHQDLDAGGAMGYFTSTALRLDRASSARPKVAERQRVTSVNLEPPTLEISRTHILQSGTESYVQCVEATVVLPLPSSLRCKKLDSISLFDLIPYVPSSDRKFELLHTYSEILSDKGILYSNTLLGHRYAPNCFSYLGT